MVITGSSRSLGRHFALACAAEGASLVINGTNETALAEVVDAVSALGACQSAKNLTLDHRTIINRFWEPTK